MGQKMYRYILFDFDGTVFDTVEGIARSVRYALNKVGLDAPEETLRCFAGPPLADIYLEKFGGTAEDAARFIADFRERYQPTGLFECRIFPGVTDLLGELRAAGRSTAVATLKPLHLAETLLAREGIGDLFDAVCGGGDEGHEGTKADIVARAMARLGALPEETVLVGDTKYDIIGAHECGVAAVGVGYGYAAPGELAAAGADVIVPDMPALRAWLLEN